MSRFLAGTTPEELVKLSPQLSGSSRLINSKVFSIFPVSSSRSVASIRDLGLTGQEISLDDISRAANRNGVLLCNLYDIFKYVDDGHWDGYAEIAAPGQIGIENSNGSTNKYIPYLRGFGGQHHIDVKPLNPWSDSDLILIAQN